MARFLVAPLGITINSKDSRGRPNTKISKAKYRDKVFIEEVRVLPVLDMSPDLKGSRAPVEVTKFPKTLTKSTTTSSRVSNKK
jgi:hypothetical protein